MITLDLSDCTLATQRMIDRLRAIKDVMRHAGPLMKSIERRIEEGHRAGVLAGTDKDGNPAPPLTYRPKPVPSYYETILGENPSRLSLAQRLGQRHGLRKGKYAGGPSNNLDSSEYRYLTGPRLAPREHYSRVLTNFGTASWRLVDGTWMAVGGWVAVVSRKSFHFLPVHFDGLPLGRNGPSKRYDLRGIRPGTMGEIREDFRNWAKLTIRELWDNPEHEYLGNL